MLVLAGGKGTRMRSAQAKVLHTALGLALLEHVLRSLSTLAADPVVVVVGHQAAAVEEAFSGRDLLFVRQEPQLGSGHAAQVAAAALARHADRPVVVVGGDTPLLRGETLERLLAHHAARRKAATLLTARVNDTGAYGRVARGSDGSVTGITEAAVAGEGGGGPGEINAGVYVFDANALLSTLGQLDNRNAQGEYYLTDVVGLLVAAGQGVEGVAVEDPSEVLGVNTLEELAGVSEILRRRRLSALMAAGVVIESPDTVSVSLDSTVEPGAVLRAFTCIEGRSAVASEARVGPFVRLEDSAVGVGAEILDHCLLRSSVIGAGASIGPFAHVRPDSRIGERCRVGNFVELKKTELGEGSKAPHLSYLGDSTIGPRVNVGAGTITCNYDGASKHPTRIEGGAFIGSNATLVAPLTVGEGAYIGAGSVVTEDVPADALALGRARQVVKPGWAGERRRRLAKGKA